MFVHAKFAGLFVRALRMHGNMITRAFFVNKKPMEVVNVRQSMVCQFSPLKVIGQFRLYGIGCKTRVKVVIGHWSVSIHLLLVRSVS